MLNKLFTFDLPAWKINIDCNRRLQFEWLRFKNLMSSPDKTPLKHNLDTTLKDLAQKLKSFETNESFVRSLLHYLLGILKKKLCKFSLSPKHQELNEVRTNKVTCSQQLVFQQKQKSRKKLKPGTEKKVSIVKKHSNSLFMSQGKFLKGS